MKVHPKRMKWIVNRLLWGVGLMLLLLVVWGAIRFKKTSLIKSVKVTILADEQGNRFVEEMEVRDILFATFGHYVEGQTLEQIDVQAVEEALEKDMFIQKADVYVDALNTVNITIMQRQPILRVMDVEDESYYLDAKGTKIPFSTKYTSRVIVATGDIGLFNEGFMELKENRLNQVFELTKKILANPFLKVQVEQIHLDHSGDAILVPKIGNHKINFGAPDENIDDKLSRLQVFYEEGLSYAGWEKYKTISLAFDGQVVAKKR